MFRLCVTFNSYGCIVTVPGCNRGLNDCFLQCCFAPMSCNRHKTWHPTLSHNTDTRHDIPSCHIIQTQGRPIFGLSVNAGRQGGYHNYLFLILTCDPTPNLATTEQTFLTAEPMCGYACLELLTQCKYCGFKIALKNYFRRTLFFAFQDKWYMERSHHPNNRVVRPVSDLFFSFTIGRYEIFNHLVKSGIYEI